MKRVFFFIVVALMLASCASTRKIQETTTSVSVDSVSVKETAKHESEKVVDTTRTEHGKITITEIVFESPVPLDSSMRKPDVCPEANKPTTKATLANVGEFSGVRSIKQTVIESNAEEKGESRETEKQEQSKSEANAVREESDIQIEQEPTPDPHRWRYIFYISLLFVALLLYLKRVPILNWIKKILAGIRWIF